LNFLKNFERQTRRKVLKITRLPLFPLKYILRVLNCLEKCNIEKESSQDVLDLSVRALKGRKESLKPFFKRTNKIGKSFAITVCGKFDHVWN
jgi:hypothetical protein